MAVTDEKFVRLSLKDYTGVNQYIAVPGYSTSDQILSCDRQMGRSSLLVRSCRVLFRFHRLRLTLALYLDDRHNALQPVRFHVCMVSEHVVSVA